MGDDSGAVPIPGAVSAALSGASGPVGFAKRRNRGVANIRKRAEDEEQQDGEGQDDEASVQRRSKAQRGDPVAFSTKRAVDGAQDGEGIKDIRFTYDSNRGIQQQHDARVTGMLETETATDRDARCACPSCAFNLLHLP